MIATKLIAVTYLTTTTTTTTTTTVSSGELFE